MYATVKVRFYFRNVLKSCCMIWIKQFIQYLWKVSLYWNHTMRPLFDFNQVYSRHSYRSHASDSVKRLAQHIRLDAKRNVTASVQMLPNFHLHKMAGAWKLIKGQHTKNNRIWNNHDLQYPLALSNTYWQFTLSYQHDYSKHGTTVDKRQPVKWTSVFVITCYKCFLTLTNRWLAVLSCSLVQFL